MPFHGAPRWQTQPPSTSGEPLLQKSDLPSEKDQYRFYQLLAVVEVPEKNGVNCETETGVSVPNVPYQPLAPSMDKVNDFLSEEDIQPESLLL